MAKAFCSILLIVILSSIALCSRSRHRVGYVHDGLRETRCVKDYPCPKNVTESDFDDDEFLCVRFEFKGLVSIA